MKVCAIILNWNGRNYIGETLDSMEKVRIPQATSLEVIVVDNCSSDDSASFIEKKYPSVKLLRNPTNMGYAAGNNRGIGYAVNTGADFIWIINSDILLAPDSLTAFLEGAAKYPRASVFGCKIYFFPGYEFYKDRYSDSERGKVIWYAGGLIDWQNVLASHRGVDVVDKGQYDYDYETDFITGAVMFLRAEIISRVGAFNPDYCFYYEENDFCQRVLAAGSKIMFLFLPKAWHKNAQSTGMGSPLQDYFLTRNRLLFGKKYAPIRAKIALFREALKLKKNGREWQKIAINDFFSSKLGAGSFTLN